MEYRYVNSVIELDDAVNYSVEFLNSLNPPGFPPHLLTLKMESYLHQSLKLLQILTVSLVCIYLLNSPILSHQTMAKTQSYTTRSAPHFALPLEHL